MDDAEAAVRSGMLAAAEPFDRPSSSRPGAQSFDGALRELKDLRSQLHEAADCCEKAFLGTDKKKLILESTKNYICDAVVAVIDHLGNVSSKLEHRLQEDTDVTQTERKMSFLKQRLLTCEQYAISLKLLTVRGDPHANQYHRRYISQSIHRTKEGNGASSSKNDAVLPQINGPTVPGDTLTVKPYNVQSIIGTEHIITTAKADERSFSFREEDVHIVLGDPKKKANHVSHILSFLKKARRHA